MAIYGYLMTTENKLNRRKTSIDRLGVSNFFDT